MIFCLSVVLNDRHRKARVLFGLSDIALIALGFWRGLSDTASGFGWNTCFIHRISNPGSAFGLLRSLLAADRGLWLQVYDRLEFRGLLEPSFVGDTSRAMRLWSDMRGVVRILVCGWTWSRPFLVMFAGFTWMFPCCSFRLTAGSLAGVARREFGGPHFVMIVGLTERARKLGAELEGSAQYGIRLVGFLALGPTEMTEVQLDAAYKIYPVEDLRRILRRQVIDEIVFAVGSDRLAELEEVFLLCDEEGVRTRVAVDFFPHVNSKKCIWTSSVRRRYSHFQRRCTTRSGCW